MKAAGDMGEAAVCEYLCIRGYEILERGFRIRGGEIDIIARKDGIIAFVECKARRASSAVSGIESVTAAQMKRIVKTALEYLRRTECELQPRFDIAGIVIAEDGAAHKIDYIENAFDATDMDID